MSLVLRVVTCVSRPEVPLPSAAPRKTLLALAVIPLMLGCHVPQKPGLGKAVHRIEAVSKRPYWLYLPPSHEDALGGESGQRRYPLVVSLHGMRPFDDYGAHIRQWQEEADRYGFMVCAPRLNSCDVLQRFPIDDPTSATLKSDEQAILAIISEVCRITDADARHVLATSFSSGGYIAHYMVNRHPERFSCLAVFQSNFTARILDSNQVSKYQDHTVAILTTENDLPLVSRESQMAVNWYRGHGFTRLIEEERPETGHIRTPEFAARVFAATAADELFASRKGAIRYPGGLVESEFQPRAYTGRSHRP